MPWVDNELKIEFAKRDKLHALALSFNNRAHPIWSTFRDFRNDCKRKLKYKRKIFFEDFDNSNKDSKSFWKFYSRIIKTKNSKQATISSSMLDCETKSSILTSDYEAPGLHN